MGSIMQYALEAGLAGAMMWVIVWFVKRDRTQIDKQIERTRLKAVEDDARLEIMATDAKAVADEARERSHAVELNYTRKFGEVNTAVAAVEKSVVAEIGKLREWMSERFVTKEALRDALAILKEQNEERRAE